MAHLVWDWNGTLLNDLEPVVEATNAAFALVGGPVVDADEHRRDFRRPIVDYYAYVLGRPIDAAEFVRLDRVFHDTYRTRLVDCALADDAIEAINAWPDTQSLLSMFFHDELVPEVTRRGLVDRLARVDGLRAQVGGGHKAEHLKEHLAALDVAGEDTVLIGDSIDDAHAADEVGAAVVLYTGGFTDPEVLRASGYPVADTLIEAIKLAQPLR
ncbi:HAD family hydrolase [Virgisporangium aurantiacum]|uniref:Phosphatase n=1 Tax=Virgisporangium aurantiacum TaxID=175570 RepID=A0A8J3Z1Q0_9ACTN|nr:HAD hydrolase-like protein [Virgisporangium aurantiacum]GIJ53730.1 phosphatase [Virgisporangium aurantiacum]